MDRYINSVSIRLEYGIEIGLKMEQPKMSATQNVFTGLAVISIGGSGRIDEAQRQRNADAIIARGNVTYGGNIDAAVAKDIADGKERKALNRTLATSKPQTLSCDVCGKAHGKPSVSDRRKGIGWKAELITHNHVLAQNGNLVLVSNTCFHKYVRPSLTAKNCSNFADVVKTFGA